MSEAHPAAEGPPPRAPHRPAVVVAVTAPETPATPSAPATMHVVRELARRLPLLPGDTTCRFVADRFSGADAPPAFAVRPDGELRLSSDGLPILGFVARAEFLAQFATAFGRELFGKKPITRLMDHAPLIVDADDAVDEVANRIIHQKPQALSQGFIVVSKGRYYGIGTGLDLLNLVALQAQDSLEALRSAQRQLIDSEKFASLGQLVAGVAHEVNTPLGIALSAATYLSGEVKSVTATFQDGRLRKTDMEYFLGKAEEATRLIGNNLKRAADLVMSFKKVAVDRSVEHRETVFLRPLIDDVAAGFGKQMRTAKCSLVVHCPQDLAVDSYPGPIAQVLTNLIQNALLHAFDNQPEGTITITGRRDGEMAEIRFADDGQGIPPEHLGRLFDPFFTTKRGRGGSGLGLNILHNIVTQRLGGSVTVESVVDHGTTFIVRIAGVLAAPAMQ